MPAGIYSTKSHVLEVFSFMKSASTLSENQARTLEVKISEDRIVGYLVPVGNFLLQDNSLISDLMNWREQNTAAYPTKFTVTESGTKNWLLNQVVENPERLLFIVCDSTGSRIGILSLNFRANEKCEIENVIKVNSDNFELISTALLTIENFVYEEIGLESCFTRVLKSNQNSANFYSDLSYEIVDEISLTESKDQDNLNLIPSDKDIVDHFLVLNKNLTEAKPVSDQILTAGPSISNRELVYVSDAVKNGWNFNHSDYINKFQSEFAEYVGAKYAIATSSCTGALHLSLLALGIGPGDEVIVPEVTWVATASAVRYTGATPVFADIDPNTWCISPQSIAENITSKTRAIMPVHLYGFAADMTEVMSLALKNNLYVVEDAAPAIGSLIGEKAAGSFGHFGAYSFQGAKMLVTGEGGMLVTSDAELFEKARKIQDHGRKPGTFWIEELGYKYKMNNITAALGLAQLQRSERQIEQKRRIAQWYKSFIGEHPKLKMQVEGTNTRSIHWMNSVTLDESLTISRDEVMEKLKAEGIDTRPVFPAISQYPIWDRTHQPGIVATRIGAQSINLPSGVKLSKKSVQRVCEAITSIVG